MWRFKSALVMAMVFGCGGGTEAEVDYKFVPLGVVVDTTGPLAMPTMDETLTLAMDRVNAGLRKAKFKDMQFSYQVYDDSKDNAMVAQERAQQAVAEGAKALITDANTATIAISTLKYQAVEGACVESEIPKVPVLCQLCSTAAVNDPNATDPDPARQCALRDTAGWNFVASVSQKFLAPVTARVGLKLAMAAKGCTTLAGCSLKFGVYAIDNNFGRGGSTGSINELKKLNVGNAATMTFETVFQPPGVDLNSYDYDADLAALTDDDVSGPPDLLLATLTPDFEIAFTRAYGLAFPANSGAAKLLHSTAFQAKTTTETLGELANDHEVITGTVRDGEAGEELAALVEEKYGYQPQKREVVLFDSSLLMMLATIHAVQANGLLDPSEVTGAMIRDSMHAVNDPDGTLVTPGTDIADVVALIVAGTPINYQGASGPLDIGSDPNANGRVIQRISHLRIENEQWVQLDQYDCVACSAVGGACTEICPLVQ
jgi:hypothetical protein